MNTACHFLVAAACLGGSVALLVQNNPAAKCAALLLVVVGVVVGARAIEGAGEVDCGRVVVYSLEGCPWCDKAKARLHDSGIAFETVTYTRGMESPPAMPDGRMPKSFPQIWAGSRNMGGFSEMDAWIGKCAAK